MKKIFLFVLLAAFFACAPHLQAEDNGGAYDQLNQVADDSGSYDGEGSTVNTSTDETSSVPDVGPSGPVGYYDESGGYHSN